MKTRVISGAVLVIIAIAVLYVGGYLTGATMLLLSIGGTFELLRVNKADKSALAVAAYIGNAIYYGLLFFDQKQYILPFFILYVLLIMSVYVFAYPKYDDKQTMAAIISMFYVSVMLSYVYQIREMQHGLWFVVMIFVCSWINDTFAYFTGVAFGKHKMAPVLSPKKSIEGLIGGILGSTIVGCVYGIIFSKNVYDLKNAAFIFAIVGAVGACVAVIGDLAASAIKRNNNIKDYSNLIPGHGGILDRFDSMIFTAPIIYYGFVFFIGNIG